MPTKLNICSLREEGLDFGTNRVGSSLNSLHSLGQFIIAQVYLSSEKWGWTQFSVTQRGPQGKVTMSGINHPANREE